MIQVTEAVYDNGALRPEGRLSLREHERVRVIIQSLGPAAEADRQAAMTRLRAGIASMGFKSNGGYPARDELHERH